MGFMDDVREDSKKYGGGLDKKYFRFEEKGVYQLRIAAKPKVLAQHFFGKGQKPVVCVGIDEGCKYHTEKDKPASIKLATYVIDRRDGNVKMGELPLSISYSINDLQDDEDFAFSEFPMPYDVKVKYDPDNADPKMKYRLAPSPKQVPLTPEEEEALKLAMEYETPEKYVEKKKAKQKEAPAEAASKGIEYPKDDIDPDDIPF